MNEEINLIKLRVVSFLYSLLGVIITAVGAYLTSEEFRALVGEHFGPTLTTTLVLIVTAEIAKHIRNVKLQGRVRVGSKRRSEIYYI